MKPRAYTAEEMRALFLQHVRAMVDYWEGRENACAGVAFSILVMLDGDSAGLPGFKLIPYPHPDDRQYNIDNDRNWWCATDICNGDMHDEFYNDAAGKKWTERLLERK